MKNKIIFLLPLLLLSASCNFFSQKINAGVVKTVNGGADWQFSNTVKNSNTNISQLNISKLVLDPTNREVVYAGSYNGGVYKSQDSAATWSRILSNILVYDLAVSPQDAKTLYAAGIFGDHGLVLKTADGGASWQQVFSEGSTANAVRSISVNPQNASQVVIGTASGNVVLSSDGGIHWKLLKNFDDRVQGIIWQGGTIYVLLNTKGLFSSTDTGSTFTDLGLVNNQSVLFGSISSPDFKTPLFNQFFVDSVSLRLIYVTTSNGLTKTVDGGKTWGYVTLPVKQSSAVAHAVAISKTSSNIVYASVDATIYKTTDGGQTWQTQNVTTKGFINYILIDPVLPQIAYAGIYVAQ